MSEVFTWIGNNVPFLMVIWASLLGAVQTIVEYTPSQRDDRILSKVAVAAESIRNLLTLRGPSSVSKDLFR